MHVGSHFYEENMSIVDVNKKINCRLCFLNNEWIRKRLYVPLKRGHKTNTRPSNDEHIE